jgi:transcriptional regulator GlxA family with amidase domain
MPDTHNVAIVVFPGVKMLDVAGPADVFAEANLNGASYSTTVVSVDGHEVTSSAGVRVGVDGPASDAGSLGTLVVAGGDQLPSMVDSQLVAAIRRMSNRAGRTASICTGSFVLAAAGLLDGKRATTHWKNAAELARRYPAISVQPDSIFVRDTNIYTSAGVTAGIDLALSLVESDHGPDMARTVARALVVHLQRPGGQSQFSAALERPAPSTPSLRSLVEAIAADPAGDHSAKTMAWRVSVSERQLSRIFKDELMSTPHRFVEDHRFELAKTLIDGGTPVMDAAALAGFASYESLRRTFSRRISLSPSQYRRRFGSTG